MVKTILVETPPDFSFRHTVGSHGWYDLPPFRIDDGETALSYVFAPPVGSRSFTADISSATDGIQISYNETGVNKQRLIESVKHILRLDEDLGVFYRIVEGHPEFGWISQVKAGRLLRSPNVFEDLVKTMCTTNCSWALTKKMLNNLVEKLGEPTSKGLRAFPTASAMAEMPEAFYREEIRAGYRSPYFVELAGAVANGDIDPESWLHSELTTEDLKKEMKRIKGVGDYAAENLLKLVGRYDGLALDSFLRGSFYKKHNKEKVCTDKKIEKHYKRFADWKGLAIWCDMTQRWFSD